MVYQRSGCLLSLYNPNLWFLVHPCACRHEHSRPNSQWRCHEISYRWRTRSYDVLKISRGPHFNEANGEEPAWSIRSSGFLQTASLNMRRDTACLLVCRPWVGSRGAYSWVGILRLLQSRPTHRLLRELASRFGLFSLRASFPWALYLMLVNDMHFNSVDINGSTGLQHYCALCFVI